tara:strand:- start:580 stop:762 length:183 start_codon:yes stop_codon:yes gene_type:complete
MQTSVTEKSSRDDVIGAALECQTIDATNLKLNDERIKDLEQKQKALFVMLGLLATYALVF